MNDHSDVKFQKEELIQKLLEFVFEKAKTESKKRKTYGITKYLNNALDNKINERTLTRYYNGFILQRKEEINMPTEYNLDVLSEYLGYDNFKKFGLSIACELDKEKIRHEKKELQKRLNTIKFAGLIISIVLLCISTLFILKYYKKNCMIWVNDHYEKIRCSGLDNEKRLNEFDLKEFVKVEVCKDSIFFVNGKPIIHYTRHNNKIEFFKSNGEHPIYKGVFTNPITNTIINSRVRDCDSEVID